MKTTSIKLLLSILILFSCQQLAAQDYDEYAQKVREEVWAWDLPEFKNYNIPDEYKNESAVILAKHDQILATGKSKFRVNAALAFGINKELLYTNTHRELIKINDKVSLEKYSSLSFKEQTKISGYMMTSKFKTIVGVRIIKPDGTIKEVNVEDEAVDITEGKKDKVDHKKLAISDLQVGDLLDYFIQNEAHVDTQNIPPLNFVFGEKYPILSYSIHCEIGRKLTVEYRSINGAPDFTASTNENKDVILDTQKKNIVKIEGIDRWVSPFRELPIIRMSILNNSSGDIWKPKTARKSGLHKDVPASTIMDDAKSAFGTYSNNGTEAGGRETKKLIDKFKKENPNASSEELAAYIYDAILYNLDFSDYYNPRRSFMKVLNFFLKYYKIENKLAFVTSRYGAPMDELANWYEVYNFLLVNDNKQIFTFNSLLNFAGEVDPDFEGETALVFADYKYKGNMIQGVESNFKVPVTDEKYNMSVSNIHIDFADDPLILKINRSTINKGNLKNQSQFRFVTREKYEEEMRARLGMEKTIQEEMDKKRSSRKYIDDYNEMIEKERRELKDKFKEEINDYHDAEPKEIAEYTVEHLGITSKHPDFIMNVKYEQEGLVQKAGNNYILNAGKLIGQQVELKEDNRKRNVDIYMPSARSYEHNVQIEIPEGYTVENIENLNKNVDNITGSFISSATFQGRTLTIKTLKVYKNAFEPVENWNKLLEMIDSAVDFYSQSVILRKT